MTDGSFSGRTLIEKLGFKPGDSLLIANAPDWYADFADQNGLKLTPVLPSTHAHIFCNSKAELLNLVNKIDIQDIEKSLWLSWPKQSSGVKTDVMEQTLRDLVLPLGWVDMKVAAIDDIWSGLKFLRRRK